MTRKTKILVGVAGGCLLPLVIGLGLAWYFLFFLEIPGGMRSSYPARDYDPRLTREAAKILPLIAAVNRYHGEHSAFPAKEEDLAAYNPMPKPQKGSAPIVWHYTLTGNGSGYTLFLSLGWDPSLQYRYNGSQGQWVFEPGDGTTDEKIIALKP